MTRLEQERRAIPPVPAGYLTVTTAGELLGVGEDAVRMYALRGKFPGAYREAGPGIRGGARWLLPEAAVRSYAAKIVRRGAVIREWSRPWDGARLRQLAGGRLLVRDRAKGKFAPVKGRGAFAGGVFTAAGAERWAVDHGFVGV